MHNLASFLYVRIFEIRKINEPGKFVNQKKETFDNSKPEKKLKHEFLRFARRLRSLKDTRMVNLKVILRFCMVKLN